MPIWGTPAVSSEPEPNVYLSRWKIYETSDGLMHLVGYDSLGMGCVSSALGAFNRDTMYAETSDGRTYRLIGRPGSYWDVADVWDLWFDANSVGVVTDVTDRLLVEATDNYDS